jgi:hypothetical protein
MDNWTHIVNRDVTFGNEFVLKKDTKVYFISKENQFSFVTSFYGDFCIFHDDLTPRHFIENPEILDRLINE